MHNDLLPERLAERRTIAEDKVKYTFGLRLLRILSREEKRNFVISPLSLGYVLAMLLPGLKGETKDRLLSALGARDEEELHILHRKLFAHEGTPLAMASRILAHENCEIHTDFDNLLEARFDSKVERVDFGEKSSGSRATVNSWVCKLTDSLIPELLPENSIDDDSSLVLLSAACFRNFWIEDFKPLPEPLDFFLDSGDIVQTTYITKKSELFQYVEAKELRIVRISLDAAFCMILAVPEDPTKNIAEIMSSMEPEEFMAAIEQPAVRSLGDVIVTMPKFKIEYDFTSVQQCLQELEARKIFSSIEGDFGNLFSKVTRAACVDRIIHKTVIEFNEKGAGLAGGPLAKCCGHRPPKIVNFDRPFCFCVLSGNRIMSFVGIFAEP